MTANLHPLLQSLRKMQMAILFASWPHSLSWESPRSVRSFFMAQSSQRRSPVSVLWWNEAEVRTISCLFDLNSLARHAPNSCTPLRSFVLYTCKSYLLLRRLENPMKVAEIISRIISWIVYAGTLEIWRGLLLFGNHTWNALVPDPDHHL